MLFSQILDNAAVLMNDSGKTEYDNETLLPMLNMAMTELKEIFELNSIPVTNETSDTITIPTGKTKIGLRTLPTLPLGLIEIRELFESVVGQEIWIPVIRKNFLTGIILPPTQITNFGVWAWINQEIRVPAAINDVDIKIDYIRDIFAPLTLANVDVENYVRNSDSFLYNHTASLASRFLAENSVKADELETKSGMAISRSLGISIKAMQAISTRRRPFRAGYKRSGRMG